MQRKVAAGGLGGAIVSLVFGITHAMGAPDVGAATGAAAVTVTTFLIAFFIPNADVTTPIGTAEKAD